MSQLFRIALLTSVMPLAGCAIQWQKPGATQQDFAKDSYECERDVRQSGYYGGGLAATLSMQEFGERCMQARGWSEVK